MKRILLIWIAAWCLSVPSAFASVLYHFEFSDMVGVTGGTGAPFAIDLTYPNYSMTTGMFALAGSALPTTLGYSVAYAGTNKFGWWAFDDDNSSVLMDYGYNFFGESFLFIPDPSVGGYITSAGMYGGRVRGNAPNGFEGSAILTVREGNNVPEPSALALLALALAGLGVAGRRNS